MLPKYVSKDDLRNRFERSQDYYKNYGIPVGVVRKDENWCEVVLWADIGKQTYCEKLFRIRLSNDDQLSSFRELLEEVCDELQIPYRV